MSNLPSSSWKRLGCFWGVAVVVLAIVIGVKVRQNIEWGRFPGSQQQVYLAEERASNALYKKLEYVIKVGMTRAQVEAVVNGGVPMPTHGTLVAAADGTHEWIEEGVIRDPATGGQVRISFAADGSRWCGYGPEMKMVSRWPSPTAAWTMGEELRDRISNIAPTAWWVLLLVWPFVRRHVRPSLMGQLLFGCGLLWLAAEYLRPYYFTPGDKPIDWICWALIATVLGAMAWLAVPSRMKPRDPNVCLNCSYNLTGNISGVCPECGTKITDIGLKLGGAD